MKGASPPIADTNLQANDEASDLYSLDLRLEDQQLTIFQRFAYRWRDDVGFDRESVLAGTAAEYHGLDSGNVH